MRPVYTYRGKVYPIIVTVNVMLPIRARMWVRIFYDNEKYASFVAYYVYLHDTLRLYYQNHMVTAVHHATQLHTGKL